MFYRQLWLMLYNATTTSTHEECKEITFDIISSLLLSHLNHNSSFSSSSNNLSFFCYPDLPHRAPTTHLGSSSSGSLQGHQLDKGMPQASRRMCTWVRRAWLACLWVLIRVQSSKQHPLRSHERQTVWSPIMGTVGVPSPV